MRIVRFEMNDSLYFGVIKDDSDKVVVLNSDPLFSSKIEPTGQIVDLVDVRLLSTVLPRSKALGLRIDANGNIADVHIKPNTSVIGPNVAIVKPDVRVKKVSSSTSLGVVIKRICKNVDVKDIRKYVLGFTVVNDIAIEIDNWDSLGHKSEHSASICSLFDTSCVVGPWVVVDKDFDINNLQMKSLIDDTTVKTFSTSQLGDIYAHISTISKYCTLLPSDIVFINSKENAITVPDNCVIKCDIENIGTLRNALLTEDE